MTRVSTGEITLVDLSDGTPGLSVFQVSVFQRASTAPSTPTGGSYNFTTSVLTAPLTWSTTIPTGSQPVWISNAIATISGTVGIDSTLNWSVPRILTENGANGINSVPIALYQKNTSDVTPPSAFTAVVPEGVYYTFSTDSLDFINYNGWSRTPPSLSKGEYLWAYQIVASSSDEYDVLPVSEWNGPNIVAIAGVDGEPGPAGPKGATGARGAGFWRLTIAPGNIFAPSGNPADLDPAGVVSLFVSELNLIPVRNEKVVIANETGAFPAKAWIWDPAFGYVPQAEFIDGNLLVQGTVTANAIAAESITGDKLSVTSLSAVSSTIGTFQSADSGERIVISDDKIQVFDANNVLRVVIGNLA